MERMGTYLTLMPLLLLLLLLLLLVVIFVSWLSGFWTKDVLAKPSSDTKRDAPVSTPPCDQQYTEKEADMVRQVGNAVQRRKALAEIEQRVTSPPSRGATVLDSLNTTLNRRIVGNSSASKREFMREFTRPRAWS